MAIKDDLITDWKWIVGLVIVFGGAAFGLYSEKAWKRHIKEVMNGPIRVNSKTRIYYVPTCPNYNSIDADRIILVKTIEEAEEAGYREAENCEDDLWIRELNEKNDPEPFEHPGDQQYR